MVDKATLYLEDILEEIFQLLQQQDFKQARYLLKKATKKYPRHYLSYYGQGMCAGFKGDDNDAIHYLELSVARNPHYGLAHYNLAISYQKVDQMDLSLKHHYLALQTATEEEKAVIPASVEIVGSLEESLPDGFTLEDYFVDADRFEVAFELLHDEKFEQAAELFQIVANNQPRHVQARGNLGICYLMSGNYAVARDYFCQALSIDPAYQPALDNMSILEDIESGRLKQPLGMLCSNYYPSLGNVSNS